MFLIHLPPSEGFGEFDVIAGGFDLNSKKYDAKVRVDSTDANVALNFPIAVEDGGVSIKTTKPPINAQQLLEAEQKTFSILLFDAVRRGDPIDIAELINSGADVNQTYGIGEHRYTALHVAVAANSIPVVKALIGSGANLNAQMKSGLTPLHIAVAKQNVPMVELLLDGGASSLLVDSQRLTARELAEKTQNQAVIAVFQKSHRQ